MILVTKDEAEYIQSHDKDIRIALTCRKKCAKRKKHYCEEWSRTYELLQQYRDELKGNNEIERKIKYI
jgi:hypothetical protein